LYTTSTRSNNVAVLWHYTGDISDYVVLPVGIQRWPVQAYRMVLCNESYYRRQYVWSGCAGCCRV